MSPYDEGRVAATSGMSEPNNPYAEGTYPYTEWQRGYGESESDGFGNDAFEEGKLAAAAGEGRDTNPYDENLEDEAEKAGRWLAGFEGADEVDEEGEPLDE